jgi:chromosome segregation ATPase
MNITESRKIVRTMLAPYQVLKHLEDVLTTAEVAEQSLQELQQQIKSLTNEVVQKTAERDTYIAELQAQMQAHTAEMTAHTDECAKVVTEAKENARKELEQTHKQLAADLAQQRATHALAKKSLADEIVRLTNEANVCKQTVEALEARKKDAEIGLEELRAKVG